MPTTGINIWQEYGPSIYRQHMVSNFVLFPLSPNDDICVLPTLVVKKMRLLVTNGTAKYKKQSPPRPLPTLRQLSNYGPRAKKMTPGGKQITIEIDEFQPFCDNIISTILPKHQILNETIIIIFFFSNQNHTI